MTPRQIADWARAIEQRPAEDILTAAGEHFAPRLGLATGFGAEGCVLVDMAARLGIDVELFTLDTGYLFPETYALWARLERRYGVTIRGVQARPSSAAADDEPEPWRRDPDRCCERRKVRPLQDELRRFDAWVTAIRSDQTPARALAKSVEWDTNFSLVKVNPLLRWSASEVWDYVRRHDVPVNPLHTRGYPSIGCAPCTTPVAAGENLRSGRWRGRAKKECGLHRPPGEAGRPITRGDEGADVPSICNALPARDGALSTRGGFILWFTGLSGAGKSTLSGALRRVIAAEGPLEILDGDEVRTNLSKGLGFSRADRDTNVRRIGYVARLLARNGVAVVTAAISPYAAARDEVRELARVDGVPFLEVYLRASIERLTERDVKGLYRKALAGEIQNFTGVSDPYEAPTSPELVVATDIETVEESATKVVALLRERRLIRAGPAGVEDRS